MNSEQIRLMMELLVQARSALIELSDDEVCPVRTTSEEYWDQSSGAGAQALANVATCVKAMKRALKD